MVEAVVVSAVVAVAAAVAAVAVLARSRLFSMLLDSVFRLAVACAALATE